MKELGAVSTSQPDDSQAARVAEKERKSRERWGPDVPIPEFKAAADSSAFKAVLKELSVKYGKPRPLFDDVECVLCFDADPESAEIPAMQQQYATQDCFVFIAQQQFGGRCLVAIPTADRYQALAVMQTSAPNYGIGPGKIIAWLKELEQAEPFVLTTVGHDLIEGEFRKPVSDPTLWAARMEEFCPDLVDQGVGTRADLVKQLKKSQRLYFWWD